MTFGAEGLVILHFKDTFNSGISSKLFVRSFQKKRAKGTTLGRWIVLTLILGPLVLPVFRRQQKRWFKSQLW